MAVQLLMDLVMFLSIATFLNPREALYIKNVTLNRTCGSPPEQYFKYWQGR